MDRHALINNITALLNNLGVPYTLGAGADISISAVFLSAGWNTGNKQITYESSIYLDDADRTVYLWELTKESGSGFSFGTDSGTTFQTGKTLFRKVKSMQYGPDGKAYEIDIDLGAIPKGIKDVSKSFNYKFKTVLNRKKASYPVKFTGTPVPQPIAAQYGAVQPPPMQVNQPSQVAQAQIPIQQNAVRYAQQPPAPQPPMQQNMQSPGQQYTHKKRINPLTLIVFLLITTAAVVLFAFSGISPLGWGVTAGLLLISFFILKSFAGKGFVRNLILLALLFAALFMVFAFATGNAEVDVSITGSNETSVDDPSIEKVGFARSVDPETKEPVEKVDSIFKQSDLILYYVFKMYNIPAGTNINTYWDYENGSSTADIDIPVNERIEGNYYAISLEASEGGSFPTGSYTLTVTGTYEGKELFKFSEDFSVQE